MSQTPCSCVCHCFVGLRGFLGPRDLGKWLLWHQDKPSFSCFLSILWAITHCFMSRGWCLGHDFLVNDSWDFLNSGFYHLNKFWVQDDLLIHWHPCCSHIQELYSLLPCGLVTVFSSGVRVNGYLVITKTHRSHFLSSFCELYPTIFCS
jgi:hypothetical protein